jgi:hypothetical protein
MQPSCLNKSPDIEFEATRNEEALASRMNSYRSSLLEQLVSFGSQWKKEIQDFSVETRTHEIPPSFTMELNSLMPEPHSKNILSYRCSS